MNAPLVSVVMPAYNAQAYIRSAVLSVLSQTYTSWELVIVDDCSTDGTAALIDSLAAADERIRVIHASTNAGVAAARNAAIAAARGSHVAFLDSDDGWHESKLERQMQHMEDTGARVCYAPYDRVGDDGRLLSRVRPPAHVSYAQMLRSNYIGNLTGIYDRSLGDAAFRKVGHEDYVFWLEMVRRAGGASCVPGDQALAYYLVRDGSVSADKWRAARWQWRIYRDVAQLGWLSSSQHMCHYAWQAVMKRVV
ncbi:glycosyltransferase family 2 protein [Dyella jiangningensis]|jgi:teichuronic acid biosynthesis glycosyltransferase TuaG|uniref:glycosyltransferase family 2 protein n=1 Tax=Dyella jiangningensis TaxID=1379159 RepID=UPI00240ECA68|nr:glycosyltransferase family 2 protein [Dyella jiangningensis]MDG2536699.1 glycosyltransferase family 2 protein [Dyella jiangningensis]